jgi:putative Holliday junction resolvase
MGMFASPYKVLSSTRNLADEVGRIVAQEKIECVVLGMPYPVDRNLQNPTLDRVREFKEELERVLSCPIVEWDESYTSRRAVSQMISNGVRKKRRRTKGTTDLWAASIILQEYLDSEAHRQQPDTHQKTENLNGSSGSNIGWS